MTRLTRFAAVALIATMVVAACGGAATPTARPANAIPSEVSVADAADLRDAGAFVLDVREPSEWSAGHIPDATLIPLGQLAARVDELPTDRTIVVVCRSGNRSAEGRDILRQSGRAKTASMAGGMDDWTAAGLPVVSGD